MNLSQLCFRDIPGSAAQQVLPGTAHRKSDDFPDIFLPPQQHDHSVDSGSHSCMGRCAELEGLVQRPELLLQRFLIISCNFKCFLHNLYVMVPHRAGRQLHAVADDIILIGKDIQRVLFPCRRED